MGPYRPNVSGPAKGKKGGKAKYSDATMQRLQTDIDGVDAPDSHVQHPQADDIDKIPASQGSTLEGATSFKNVKRELSGSNTNLLAAFMEDFNPLPSGSFNKRVSSATEGHGWENRSSHPSTSAPWKTEVAADSPILKRPKLYHSPSSRQSEDSEQPPTLPDAGSFPSPLYPDNSIREPKHGPTSHTNILGPSVENVVETTTCWIAAENALQHAQAKHLSVAEVFNSFNITTFQYHVQAGFDEELIKSGIGYLEQIHVFVLSDVSADSPLLSGLGALFSPFSSILFTKSNSFRLPVSKEDGSLWEFEELVYFNATKIADGGKNAKTPLTVISYSTTSSLAGGVTGFSQGSGGKAGDIPGDRRIAKGKGRDRGERGGDGGEENDTNKPPEEPEDPSKGQSGNIAGPKHISFEIASDIYPNDCMSDLFQTLIVHGGLAIETTPFVLSPPQNSERHVHFTKLKFDTEPLTEIAYRQLHVRVEIDSKQRMATAEDIHPIRTTSFDVEEKVITSSKTGRSRGVTAGLTVGPHPQALLAATITKTREENAGLELKRNRSAINDHQGNGSARWGFNIDDPNLQKWGINMKSQNILPKVRFVFIGASDVPEPPPKDMDTVISSYWTMIPPEGARETWIRRLFGIFKVSGKDQARSYSNLFNVVVLRTSFDPSNGPEKSHYKAKVDVVSGTSQPPLVEREAAKTFDVTSLTVDDLEKMSTFKIPTIANLKLSSHCVPTLEASGRYKKPLGFIIHSLY